MRWRDGAKLLEGGRRPDAGPGWFYAPTVLTDVDRGHAVVCEEVFGPIASIQVVEGCRRRDCAGGGSEYGLGANIYTQNLTWALTAMQEIKAGTFWINDPLTDNDAAPFGGMRKSGMGRELGEEGLDAFRETKHVHLDFVPERKAFWFPYAPAPPGDSRVSASASRPASPSSAGPGRWAASWSGTWRKRHHADVDIVLADRDFAGARRVTAALPRPVRVVATDAGNPVAHRASPIGRERDHQCLPSRLQPAGDGRRAEHQLLTIWIWADCFT